MSLASQGNPLGNLDDGGDLPLASQGEPFGNLGRLPALKIPAHMPNPTPHRQHTKQDNPTHTTQHLQTPPTPQQHRMLQTTTFTQKCSDDFETDLLIFGKNKLGRRCSHLLSGRKTRLRKWAPMESADDSNRLRLTEYKHLLWQKSLRTINLHWQRTPTSYGLQSINTCYGRRV